MRLMLTFCIAFWGLGMSGLPSAAQPAGQGLGALSQYLPQSGQDEVWRYSNTQEGFEIENIGDPQAIKYFFVGPAEGSEGRRRIELDIDIHPESQGAAGLLYGLNDARDLYHLLTLDAQGMVTVFRRDASGFRPMLEQSSSAYLPGQINRLRIEENGDEITFLLNGTELGAIGGDLFGFGSVGVAAVGDVQAFFSYFSDEAGSDRSQLQPQGTTDGTQVAQTPPVPAAETGQPVQTAGLTADMLQMQRLQSVDRQSPAGQMVAYETLIPEGWKTQGGIL